MPRSSSTSAFCGLMRDAAGDAAVALAGGDHLVGRGQQVGVAAGDVEPEAHVERQVDGADEHGVDTGCRRRCRRGA